MMSVEKDEALLLEYGRVIVRINGIELMLKYFLAYELTKLNASSKVDELKMLETKMLGEKLGILRDKIMKASERPQLSDLYSCLDQLNDKRTQLAHAVSAESVMLDSEKKPHASGKYILMSYSKRNGTIVPEESLTKDMLSKAAALADDAFKFLYACMTDHTMGSGTHPAVP